MEIKEDISQFIRRTHHVPWKLGPQSKIPSPILIKPIDLKYNNNINNKFSDSFS